MIRGGHQPEGGNTPPLPTTVSGVKPARPAFDFNIDRESRTITIQGVKYAFELFDQLGFGPEGRVLRIGQRTDCAVTLHQVDTHLDAATERDRLAKLVEQMIGQSPKSIYDTPTVRMALAIAASVVRRGRHLTTREQMLNLANGMEEPIDGDTPEDIAAAKDLADRIRASVGGA